MTSIYLRAICRKASSSLGSQTSFAFLSTALAPRAHQFHQLGTVRHASFRYVVPQKKPSEVAATDKSTLRTTPKDQSSEQQDPVSKGNSSEKRESAAQWHHSLSRRIEVDKWRSNLVLPSDAYWKKWKSALKTFDAGGLETALTFVERWKLASPKITFTSRKHDFPTVGRKRLFECTSQVPLALLGVRKVVSYGYSKQEAFDNQAIARLSMLYQTGELDTIYKGTITSRRLMGIYEQAAKYGLFVKFTMSMTNDQPDAHYKITLAVPKWDVEAVATAPTYIEALHAAVRAYKNLVKKDDVKISIRPQATPARLEILSFKTASRALRFLTGKLQTEELKIWTTKLDAPGPQWMYRVAVGKCYNPPIPMLRSLDAHFVGTITAVVRILQHFGFHLIDGFKEHLEAAKDDAAKSRSLNEEHEVEVAGQSHGDSLEQEGVDQVVEGHATPESQEMDGELTQEVAKNDGTRAGLAEMST